MIFGGTLLEVSGPFDIADSSEDRKEDYYRPNENSFYAIVDIPSSAVEAVADPVSDDVETVLAHNEVYVSADTVFSHIERKLLSGDCHIAAYGVDVELQCVNTGEVERTVAESIELVLGQEKINAAGGDFQDLQEAVHSRGEEIGFNIRLLDIV